MKAKLISQDWMWRVVLYTVTFQSYLPLAAQKYMVFCSYSWLCKQEPRHGLLYPQLFQFKYSNFSLLFYTLILLIFCGHFFASSLSRHYRIVDEQFVFEGNQVGPKMDFSKQIQTNDNFEGLRVIGFRISASPSISKEIHALAISNVQFIRVPPFILALVKMPHYATVSVDIKRDQSEPIIITASAIQ